MQQIYNAKQYSRNATLFGFGQSVIFTQWNTAQKLTKILYQTSTWKVAMGRPDRKDMHKV